ncbi:MAG: hypothetical protein V1770_04100 [bacterium]
MEIEKKVLFKKGDVLIFDWSTGSLLFSAGRNCCRPDGRLKFDEEGCDNKILFSSASRLDIISILQLLKTACGTNVKLLKEGDAFEHYIVE